MGAWLFAFWQSPRGWTVFRTLDALDNMDLLRHLQKSPLMSLWGFRGLAPFL